MLKYIDVAVLILSHIVPIILIAKYKMIGYLFGTVFVWLSLFFWGIIIHKIDPPADGVTMVNHLWLFSGWLYGLIILGPVYYFFIKNKKKTTEQTSPVNQRPAAPASDD